MSFGEAIKSCLIFTSKFGVKPFVIGFCKEEIKTRFESSLYKCFEIPVFFVCAIFSTNMIKFVLVILIFLHSFDSSHSQFTRATTPHTLQCPGINVPSINLVRVGVMLSMPSDEEALVVGVNLTNYANDLVPGELLLNASYIAAAALRQAKIINEERQILPNHDLCLFFTFVPSDLQDVTRGSNYVYGHSRTYQTINALTDSYQFKVNRDLMVSYGNLVNVVTPQKTFECPVTPNAFNALFAENSQELYDEQCEPGLFNTNLQIQPKSIGVLKAAKLLVEELGWKRYGIISSCASQEIWQHEQRGIFFSIYNGNFLSSFKVFQENEINVIIFAGTVCMYFDFLIQAYDNNISISR